MKFENVTMDDVQNGLYLVITHCHVKEPYGNPMMGYGEKDKWIVDGTPWKVDAVALPFVMMSNQGRKASMDLREVDVMAVPLEYAIAGGAEKAKKKRSDAEVPHLAGIPDNLKKLIEGWNEEAMGPDQTAE